MRILYIEADELARKAFFRFTPRRGVVADVAATEAEAFVAARIAGYDAVIVDSDVRDGLGLELLRELAMLQPDAVLVLTGGQFNRGATIQQNGRTIHVLDKPALYDDLFEILSLANKDG